MARKLASKYARAFCTVYAHTWSLECVDRLEALVRVLSSRTMVSLLGSLQSTAPEYLSGSLEKFMCARGIPQEVGILVDVLLRHRRIFLIAQTLLWVRIYRMRELGVEVVTLLSSAPLTHSQVEEVRIALEVLRACRVRMRCAVDRNLIAGFCIVGEEYVWEYSVRDQLNRISQQCSGDA